MTNKNYDLTNNWFSAYAKQIWPSLLNELRPLRVLEIGSFEGAATCYLLEKSVEFGIQELHCIDTWEGGVEELNAGTDMQLVYQRFTKNIELARQSTPEKFQLTIHKNFSDLALASLLTKKGRGYFDFIYIDGSHQAADVICDAVLAFRLLRVGGVLAFDDYLWAEVLNGKKDILRCPKPAIDAFVNIYFNKVNIIQTPMYQLYTQKISD